MGLRGSSRSNTEASSVLVCPHSTTQCSDCQEGGGGAKRRREETGGDGRRRGEVGGWCEATVRLVAEHPRPATPGSGVGSIPTVAQRSASEYRDQCRGSGAPLPPYRPPTPRERRRRRRA